MWPIIPPAIAPAPAPIKVPLAAELHPFLAGASVAVPDPVFDWVALLPTFLFEPEDRELFSAFLLAAATLLRSSASALTRACSYKIAFCLIAVVSTNTTVSFGLPLHAAKTEAMVRASKIFFIIRCLGVIILNSILKKACQLFFNRVKIGQFIPGDVI